MEGTQNKRKERKFNLRVRKFIIVYYFSFIRVLFRFLHLNTNTHTHNHYYNNLQELLMMGKCSTVIFFCTWVCRHAFICIKNRSRWYHDEWLLLNVLFSCSKPPHTHTNTQKWNLIIIGGNFSHFFHACRLLFIFFI